MSAAGQLPAFPLPQQLSIPGNADARGLTKRELFAAMALSESAKIAMIELTPNQLTQSDKTTKYIAAWSVALADALILELNK